jgi:signal transduction histidine kinase
MYSEDAMNDPQITPEEYEHSWARVGVRSAIAYPIVKGERSVAALVIQEGRPRPWTGTEMKLVSEVAERTWEAARRARVEEALSVSEEQYRSLFTSIDEGFCTIEVIFDEQDDPVDFRLLRMNPAFERQTGPKNVKGRTVGELALDLEEFWFEVYGRIARTGEAMRFEHEAAAAGRYYDVYAFRIGGPEKNHVAVIFNDILARKQAEEERERLRSLEASAHAEAAERERIGRELHDRVAHTMAVAHQSLQLHRALADRDPARAAEKLDLARECTRTALDQTRDLSAQLARQNTEETRDGLSAALRVLLETHVPDGVEAELSVAGDEMAVRSRAAEEAYLVMREAARNAVAHSGCGRIDVSLEIADTELKGHVRDDGTGFDQREPPDGGRDGREDGGYVAGVGLRSMRERTGQLGGQLEVHSEPGLGTTVEVRVPLVG